MSQKQVCACGVKGFVQDRVAGDFILLELKLMKASSFVFYDSVLPTSPHMLRNNLCTLGYHSILSGV